MRPTSTYAVDFAPKATSRPTVVLTGRVPRVVRLLALAHRIDAMIQAGELKGLAHAAKACGVTRPRMSQVMGLLLLAPAIQAELLALPPVTTGRDPATERQLRRIVAEPVWERQMESWRKIYG